MTRSALGYIHIIANSIWGLITGLQSFTNVQAHRFACHPDCSYRSVFQH
jgi:hypothetical protein